MILLILFSVLYIVCKLVRDRKKEQDFSYQVLSVGMTLLVVLIFMMIAGMISSF